MNNQRIFWFQDSVKMKHWSQNNEINQLNQLLIEQAGNPSFTHVVVDPQEQAKNLLSQLAGKDFTVIIDLSGLWRQLLEPFIRIPIIDKIRLSRLRMVSSPRLDGFGYLMSISHEEIETLGSTGNLSKPLILDDVGWTGKTSLEVSRLLKLDLHQTTFGFLAVNEGTFGNKSGAAVLLREKGAQVISGCTVETPQDDGFHLADFVDNRHLTDPAVFDIVIEIQRQRELVPDAIDVHQKNIETKIHDALTTHRSVLFPGSISSDELQQIKTEGRLTIDQGIPKNAFFGVNPPNWLLPSWSKRVLSMQLRQHQKDIIDTLRKFNEIKKQDAEVTHELTLETQLFATNKEKR